MQTSVGILSVLLYAAPLALLALGWSTRASQPRGVVISVLLTLPLFYLGHYLLWQQAQGWPSDAELPSTFRLLGFDVTEPDPRSDDPGQILLWIRGQDSKQPRAYRLTYAKPLHQALIDAGEKTSRGLTQVGRRVRGQSQTAAHQAAGPQVSIRFSDEQPPALPAKE